MKKFILSVLALTSLSATSNARDKMYVKSIDNEIVKFDVENVAEVYFASEYDFETEDLLYDSVGIKLYDTPTMTRIPKPENFVENTYLFEYWYQSSNLDNDIDTIFAEYQRQATILSTNKEMPIFWCTDYGNTWSEYKGQQWNSVQKNFYFSLPNVTDPNGDVDEKGQVWAVVVIKYADNRLRVVVKMDSIKHNGKYYMYDQGDGNPKI
ncbi:MAG: hypothetical protein E7077_10150 [Bacteroidales bacterium]|jgi:hypothetical protein|nr:hypothetical protein [Bacteroidales bacterium]